MKQTILLAYKNVSGRGTRTAALAALAAFLAFALFMTAMVISALRKGFVSLQERLGADIMVVPYEAATRSSLENIVLQGNTGYFYMNSDVLDKISQMEGIERISAQYYLASATSSCCSIPVQIIGYDPQTDFTITPWIRKSNGRELKYLDVVVGNDLNAFVGDTLSFYGVDVRVAAKLDKTGTGYDTAVFTGRDTIKTLIQASLDKKLNEYGNINAGNVISCVLVDVADDAVVEEVLNDINLHVKKVKAVQTKEMISGIAGSLAGVSHVGRLLSVCIWILALMIMAAAFLLMTGERKREFALLRIVGSTRRELALLVIAEGIMVSLLGGLLGIVLGVIVLIPFSGLLEQTMGLPFLLPSGASMAAAALTALILCALSGAAASGISAYRIAGADTGTMLRTG